MAGRSPFRYGIAGRIDRRFRMARAGSPEHDDAESARPAAEAGSGTGFPEASGLRTLVGHARVERALHDGELEHRS